MELIPLILFGICALLQLAYWCIMFPKLVFHQEIPHKGPDELPPLSIIICAYNEEENIRKHLPSILNQHYPDFEVLVIDDASTDGTKVLLQSLAQQYQNLRFQTLEYPDGKQYIGKKHALSQGIRLAQNDIVLLTDADCHPESTQWARIMASSLGPSRHIGVGYGPYEKKQGFLNLFIRFETLYTAIQYMSFSLWGMTYMGVGRNMIYDRKLFFEVGGFNKHAHIPSGDDDLFINEVANHRNTSVVINKESFMFSPPKEDWAAYFRQKSRHVTTGRHYQLSHQLLLGLLSLSHFGLYFFAFVSMICGISIIFVTLLLLAVALLKTTTLAITAKALQERDLIPFIPLLDIIYVLYYVLLTPALMWGQTRKWK